MASHTRRGGAVAAVIRGLYKQVAHMQRGAGRGVTEIRLAAAPTAWAGTPASATGATGAGAAGAGARVAVAGAGDGRSTVVHNLVAELYFPTDRPAVRQLADGKARVRDLTAAAGHEQWVCSACGTPNVNPAAPGATLARGGEDADEALEHACLGCMRPREEDKGGMSGTAGAGAAASAAPAATTASNPALAGAGAPRGGAANAGDTAGGASAHGVIVAAAGRAERHICLAVPPGGVSIANALVFALYHDGAVPPDTTLSQIRDLVQVLGSFCVDDAVVPLLRALIGSISSSTPAAADDVEACDWLLARDAPFVVPPRVRALLRNRRAKARGDASAKVPVGSNGRKPSFAIIGGMGPEATINLQALIQQACVELAGVNSDQAAPAYYCRMFPFSDRTTPLLEEDMATKKHLHLRLTSQLCETMEELDRIGGVEFVCAPCNTAHAFIPGVVARYPQFQLVNMLEEVAKHAAKLGARTFGLMSTSGTARTGIYNDVLSKYGIRTLIPDDEHLAMAMDAIYGPLQADGSREPLGIKAGPHMARSERNRKLLLAVGKHLLDRRADVLGYCCTEIPLCLDLEDFPDGVALNPNKVLAEAVVRRAYGLADTAAGVVGEGGASHDDAAAGV